MVPELHDIVTEKEVIPLQEVRLSLRLPLDGNIWHSQRLVILTQFKEDLTDVLCSDWDLGHWRETIDGSVHRDRLIEVVHDHGGVYPIPTRG